MPYKDDTARRLASRERQRRYRERQKKKKKHEEQNALLTMPQPADPVGALASWSREKLVVPPGHPLAGDPMVLPEYAEEFLRAGWDAHESACSVARKNAKTAACAVLCLGFLVGPLRSPGWRGAIASISKEKASELRKQVADIAIASGLCEIRIRKSPYPGAIESATGSLDTLSADRSAGHASGYDLVVVDETGLLPERSRELLAGLRSSVSAKGGRIVHISVQGDSRVFREILANPMTVSRVYCAPEGCELDDVEAWKAANPTLGNIKQLDYMSAEVERIQYAPGDEPSFRAFDLNQKLDPMQEMICAPGDLAACFVDELPPRAGPVVIGFDFGEAVSATAACMIWPETGRAETMMGYGDKPPISKRARRDDAPYQEMIQRGELVLYPGRVVKVDQFLTDVEKAVTGYHVIAAAADSYKDSEAKDFLDEADLRWPVSFRRVGAGRDGSQDVRAFQRLLLQKKIAMHENLSLATAIRKSTMRRDPNGNPGIDRANSRGRIDVLSAAVIACGLAEPMMNRPPRARFVYGGLA